MVRLTDLPPELLSKILSNLDTVDAAKTSVLARSYKDLWAKSPDLNITFNPPPDWMWMYFIYDPISLKRKTELFEENINNLLKRRKTFNVALKSCRLSLYQWVKPAFIDMFIRRALKLEAENLEIRACRTQFFPAAKISLDSSCLTRLQLVNVNEYSIRLPKSVNLPNLGTLHLERFKFSHKNSSIFGCPKLKDLCLVNCKAGVEGELEILEWTCLMLRRLEIKNWSSPLDRFDEQQIIRVNSPDLMCFILKGVVAKVEFNDVLPNLDDADIDLLEVTNDTMDLISPQLLYMVNQLKNVRLLCASTSTMKVLSHLRVGKGAWPVLNYLERLHWKMDECIYNLKYMVKEGSCQEVDEKLLLVPQPLRSHAAANVGINVLAKSPTSKESFRYTPKDGGHRLDVIQEILLVMHLKTEEAQAEEV